MEIICFSDYASGVGLWEWKITKVHSILTIMFKNILRTSVEDEIFKIFKNIQPQPKN